MATDRLNDGNGNARVPAQVERPVDGDTVRVVVGGVRESVRIQALDTEESKAGGDKPVTPWGIESARVAAQVFVPGRTITLDFDLPSEGGAPPDLKASRFRDNFGRLLALVFVDGEDFQRRMIEGGHSPYFCKYGHVRTKALHRAYLAAERTAMAAGAGLWDQPKVNGSEQRNYAALGAWWALRAEVIDDFRRSQAAGSRALNPRVHHEAIVERARAGGHATVFTEFGAYRRLGTRKAVIDIGSVAQPFSIFVPDIETEAGQRLLNLVARRYLSEGTEAGRTVTRPGRGYGYVRGMLKLFDGRPEIVAHGPEDVSDDLG
jgi:micrococcal nuclease